MSAPWSAAALEFFAERAIDPAVAADVGVLEQNGSIVFPYRRQDGSTFDRRRDLNGTGKAKVRQPKGVPLAAWCPRGRSSRFMLVCEGETDALAAMSALLHSPAPHLRDDLDVVAIPGTSFPIDKLELDGVERVTLAFDGDDAGRKATEKATAVLRASRISVSVVPLEDGEDLADVLVGSKNRGETIADLILDAETVAQDAESPVRHDLSDLTVDAILAADPGLSKEKLLDANPLLKALLGGKEKVADRVVKLVQEEGVQLFHDENRVAYAVVEVDGHLETHRVTSREFSLWVRNLYHQRDESVLSTQARKDAEGLLEAKAVFEGETVPVHLRVAGDVGVIYIDLGDEHWRALRITADGWDVLAQHPVRFRRTGGMAPLPVPARGGSLDELCDLLNLETEADRRLAIAWLLDASRPGTPNAVLEFTGEEGTAKSTASRAMRSMIDPSTTPLRSCPTKLDDLMVSANASWVAAFDNVSGVQQWLSDGLCRLATGGGQSKRELFTDDGEHLIDVRRPVVINGIEEVATRGDLLRRTLRVELPVIEEEDRLTEAEFWTAYDAIHPRLLGALCDALSCALRRVGDIHLVRKPSMADLAMWVTAAEPSLGWPDGAFMEAYEGRRQEAHEAVIEAELVGPYVRQKCDTGYEGLPGELLAELDEMVDGNTRKRTEWPKSPRKLSGGIKRLAPALRKLGYRVERGKHTELGTPWILGKKEHRS